MNWLLAAVVSLAGWTFFGFYSRKAALIHGVAGNIFWNGMAYAVLTIWFTVSTKGEMFRTMTRESSRNGMIAGVTGVAVGYLFFTIAIKNAPSQNAVGLVLLITGFFPITAMVVGRMFYGVVLSPQQWAGVALAGVALILINWK